MLQLRRSHHVALICSDYERSKAFYVNLLGLRVVAEHYRAQRPSRPEAQGLRHLALAVDDVAQAKAWLESQGVEVEPVRVDEYTGHRFTFFADPDGLPLELYEANASRA